MDGSDMAPRSALERLLHPRSIAVIGGNWAAKVIQQCERIGFDGPIWAVNKSRENLAGRPCFMDLEHLPDAPDVAFVAIPPDPSVEAIRYLAARDAGSVVCFASGFAETGAAGAERQKRLVEAAGSMPVLGPNCYGYLNYLHGAALWPDVHGGVRVESGVGMILQSGNMAVNVTMQDRSLPMACVFSVGNQAVTGMPHLIEAMAKDPRITAIGLHIEGISDVGAFSRAAVVAAEHRTPIVALKTGRSDQGARIALSHTSSLAGSDAAMDALLRRLGIARVETLPQFLETLKFLHVHPSLPGNRIVSMSCSGGEAALAADMAERIGLETPPFAPDRQAVLEAVLGEKVAVGNPLDYHTYIWEDEPALIACYTEALRADVDAGILIFDYPKPGSGDETGWILGEAALKAAFRATGRPAVVCASIPESLPESARERLLADGIVPAQGLEEALLAIRAAADIGRAWRRGVVPPAVSGPLDGSAAVLDEWRSKRLLARFGLTVPDGSLVSTEAEAVAAAEALGYPVAVKAVSDRLAHKSEVGGVRIGLMDGDAVSDAAAHMLTLTDRILVERMVTDAVAELIVGVDRDPTVGPLLMIGAGGVLAELLRDTAVLLLPASRAEVETALDGLKVAALLDGWRGRPKGDRAALVDAVLAVARFAEDHVDRLHELDVNPLMVRPEGHGVVAADAVIRMRAGG